MIQWISRGAGIQILGILTLNSPCSFSSVAQSSLTLCDPMDCSMPGFPVHHQLLKLAQIHVHQVGDAIQPSHPLLPPSPPTFNLPGIRVFSNESVLHIRWPSIRVLAMFFTSMQCWISILYVWVFMDSILFHLLVYILSTPP